MNVNAYIAGVSLGSPGPGAWGVVLVGGDHRKEQSGSEWMTTGNRMVLTSKDGKKVEARCHPDDDWRLQVGIDEMKERMAEA